MSASPDKLWSSKRESPCFSYVGVVKALQRETLLAYYIEELNIVQIAQRRGIHKSTVSRTLKRAESRLRRFLRY